MKEQIFIDKYSDILSKYDNEQMYEKLKKLDDFAENCLDFSEFTRYYKETVKMLQKIKEV